MNRPPEGPVPHSDHPARTAGSTRRPLLGRARRLRPRHLVWLLLLLVPADLLADALGAGPVLVFWLSVAALVPIAYVIGEATEHAGEHTGSLIAGLLNASFGNAPELIVAVLAVTHGLPDVVLGSLTGSIVSNLLLVLGVSTIVARRGRVNRRAAGGSLMLAGLAVVLFSLTTMLGHTGDSAGGIGSPLVIAVCIALLVAYIGFTTISVRRAHAAHTEYLADREEPDSDEQHWPLATALIVLGVATLATVGVSETLTSTIKQFAESAGLPQFFVAAVIVAIVGNATEHGGAILIANRGRLDLAGQIAFSSGAQVATLVLPAVVLVAVAINALPLDFRPVELITIAIAIAVPALLLLRRTMTVLSGVVLCAVYVGLAAVYYFV
ncbi:hypothetical protein FOE78_01520 [Microlunatus elymi]|uniref:Sodium/calcium exchanger membrane region domain-containing protein n=1 Tax=Microlunatus elymi TaxID=2596828 RepID=A0A516PUE2_9ACTN|nr:hypothetical protein [Microlunatus elymi]QDP94769.1 hypothetical protein FOE78_01520 [Microlunatus elymi]